jgi:hypothetical protein
MWTIPSGILAPVPIAEMGWIQYLLQLHKSPIHPIQQRLSWHIHGSWRIAAAQACHLQLPKSRH